MEDFDQDPLDLFDDDGDGVVEMCVLFDEDGKAKKPGSKPPNNSGCCVVLLALGASIGMTVWGATRFFA
ncbi:MAG: hypothetical protein PF442_10795 [Desulfobulbaceae bacterium]|jgi:hypothetical protein|nr:hypothetical protein [Desulfobulbaceae bacterium]